MNILNKGKIHQQILVTLVFNICVSPHAFLACLFCLSLSHQTDNCPYRSSSVLLAHIILTNHKLYLVSLLVQSSISNIQNSVYPLTLPNVACRESIIPHVSTPLTKNVMQQNPIGFPNSMYPHVGPHTPYFGFGYKGIGVFLQCGLLCLIP